MTFSLRPWVALAACASTVALAQATPPPAPGAPPPAPAAKPAPAPQGTAPKPAAPKPAAKAAPEKKPEGLAADSFKEVAFSCEGVPVGVATSPDGRVFLAFSRAIDETNPYSVAELKDGKTVPFPEGFQQDKGEPAKDRLLSVQSVIVDPKDRLWILDSGRVGDADVAPGSAKLVAVDLKTGKAVKTIVFPENVAGSTSFLNDVRVDLTRGKSGTAYLTDASPAGDNALVVVDLATGKATRRLVDHASVKADPSFTATVDGKPLLLKSTPQDPGKPPTFGADGIALGANGDYVYYSPLSSRHLYRVDAKALANPKLSEKALAAKVEDLGDKGFASDGLLSDAKGNVYLTDYEHDAVWRLGAAGKIEKVISSPQLAWPDSLSLADDGTLYVTATQIEKGKRFNGGKDLRKRPFQVFTVTLDAKPLRLGAPERKARSTSGR